MQNTTLLYIFLLARYSILLFDSGIHTQMKPSPIIMLSCLFTRIIRLNNYLLVFSIDWYGMLQLVPPQHIRTHRLTLFISFRTTTPTYYLLPSSDRICFRITKISESNLTQACIDGPFLAAVYGKSAFRYITALILMDAIPPNSKCSELI